MCVTNEIWVNNPFLDTWMAKLRLKTTPRLTGWRSSCSMWPTPPCRTSRSTPSPPPRWPGRPWRFRLFFFSFIFPPFSWFVPPLSAFPRVLPPGLWAGGGLKQEGFLHNNKYVVGDNNDDDKDNDDNILEGTTHRGGGEQPQGGCCLESFPFLREVTHLRWEFSKNFFFSVGDQSGSPTSTLVVYNTVGEPD